MGLVVVGIEDGYIFMLLRYPYNPVTYSISGGEVMNDEIQIYMMKYCDDIQKLFTKLRKLIMQSAPCEVEEKMWAKLPSYYIGDKFIRIIPFKDHINIEAKAIIEHTEQLKQFKVTPKGMLQIYINKDIPENVLNSIFRKTLIE
jgi:hypothetical protein